MIVESNLVGLLFTTGFSTRMVWNISNNDFLSINKVKAMVIEQQWLNWL